MFGLDCGRLLLFKVELISEVAGSPVQVRVPSVFNNVVAACVDARLIYYY